MAVVASAAARGGAIPLLACAETRVLAFAHPELGFASAFAWVLRCFIAKKCPSRRAALCKNVLTSTFRIVFVGVFLFVVVGLRLGL